MKTGVVLGGWQSVRVGRGETSRDSSTEDEVATVDLRQNGRGSTRSINVLQKEGAPVERWAE